MRGLPWYEILLAARRVAKRRGDRLFTPLEVGSEAEIGPSARSSIHQIAAAWCSKFVRWGYARRVGKEPGPRRSVTAYYITDWGLKFRPASAAKIAANPRRPR